MSNIFFNCLNNIVEKHKKKFKREKCSSSPGPFQSQNSQFIFPKTSIHSVKNKVFKNVIFSNIWVLYLTYQFFGKKL